jgi:hypothetical protein
MEVVVGEGEAYGGEVSECEYAEKTSLAACTIADYDELPASWWSASIMNVVDNTSDGRCDGMSEAVVVGCKENRRMRRIGSSQ